MDSMPVYKLQQCARGSPPLLPAIFILEQLILQEPLEYVTSNLTLDPGSWKASSSVHSQQPLSHWQVRMNFTSNDPAYLGHFVIESEEFFIVTAAHDSPNCTSTSTSTTAPASTPTGSSAGSGGGNSAVSAGGGGAVQSGSATDGGNPAQSSGPVSGKNGALVLIPGLYTTLFGVWSLGFLLVFMQ
ncbi:hypothetical protein C8F01DRAFT_1260862 [Mycena amicta]|nr:hypothetical protein C8F01DRAFT_1260862 [Mycena amicta]